MGIRKNIILEKGIPILVDKGFEKSPYLGADYGWHPGIGYFYELYRLRENSILEKIKIDIVKGDRWIKIWLNVFELTPKLNDLIYLNEIDGIKFNLPPLKSSEMRIHTDDRQRKIPLLDPEFWRSSHKLRKNLTKSGFKKSISILSEQIEIDFKSIDSYFDRWHQIHKPKLTTWEGVT